MTKLIVKVIIWLFAASILLSVGWAFGWGLAAGINAAMEEKAAK